PQLSPDGRQVLIQINDATADGGRSHLWLVDITQNTARQLTWSAAGDKKGEHEGRWMPDGGSVLFLAKRGEQTQLYRLPMAGGESRVYDLTVVPLVDASAEPGALPPKKAGDAPVRSEPLPIDVEDYEIAPNGRTIAILARDPETAGEKKQKEAKADAVWVDHEPHGKRLYFLDPGSGKLTPVGVAPDVIKASWSKSGDRIMVIAQGPNHASELAPSNSAWLVAVSDPDHPSQVKQLPATIEGGSWSDDGRFYFLAQCAQDAPPGYTDLYVLNLADGSIQNLSADIEGSIAQENPIVGNGVLQSVQLGTRSATFQLKKGKREIIKFDSAVVSQLNTNAKQTGWVWLGTSSTQPVTLYYAEKLGRRARMLNTPSLLPPLWTPVASRLIKWKSDAFTIEGLLYLPPGAAGRKIPLIVDVHGGPTGAWVDSFNPLTDLLLAQGWAVLRPNPRGSSGYGTAFVAANKNDLGGGDYRDIMAGVDAVIEEFPIDSDKLALIGYSYGGEMAGFVEGKTDRFKAIVSGAPVIDQQSEYGTEDESWYDRWFYGKPWEHAEDAWRQSPLANVAHATTPFLLLQGEDDKTDPLGQSQEMYRALRQAGVTVEMVQYPREDHGPLSAGLHGFPNPEPWHGFDARQRLVKFIQTAFEKASKGG
ncbi:MAG TPA: prolyl oligopeptidase family serine peptidase, partial [Steroidobacteraceae bacterium]|nr:prolyl oligopeptidase family serine peptidase [Steroidobacteraceae bacterium]